MAHTKSSSPDWNASQYLKFSQHRTRPVHDLLDHIPLANPKHIVDLGCGPGNSTQPLVARYPDAHVVGIDSSPNMLAKARALLPQVTFTEGDVRSYQPTDPVDLLVSNAFFLWLPDEERIPTIAALIQTLPPGGVFAFQVPDNFSQPSYVAIRETASDGLWAASPQARDPLRERFPLEDHQAIVEWVKGTGLRPYIDPLSEGQREQFLNAYFGRIEEAYPQLHDGKVMLRCVRLFMVGVRA